MDRTTHPQIPGPLIFFHIHYKLCGKGLLKELNKQTAEYCDFKLRVCAKTKSTASPSQSTESELRYPLL